MMKYLRLFEAYVVDDEVKDLINWDMIEDVKEMALEDIDEGFELVINIYFNRNDFDVKNKYLIYQIQYSHNIDRIDTPTTSFNYYRKIKNLTRDKIDTILYQIYLYKSGVGVVIHNHVNNLLDRVKDAYPNEKFICTIK